MNRFKTIFKLLYIMSKREYSRLRWYYKVSTSRLRISPNCLIIGAQKSGTSSLFKYLIQHPQILGSTPKEVHYFDGGINSNDDLYLNGKNWYKAHFPIKLQQKNFIGLEGSPLYFFNPLAAKRIYMFNAKMKLILLLRDPTQRAISHYFQEVRRGREDLPIEKAMKLEEERLKSSLSNQNFKDNSFIHFSYKSRGKYVDQLKQYIRYFPLEQIMIISSESFFGDIQGTLLQIFSLLGITKSIKNITDLTPKNISTNKHEVSSDVIKYLDNYFRPYNEALYEVTGKNFHWGE